MLSYYGKEICALNSLFQIIMNFVKVLGYLPLLKNVNSDSWKVFLKHISDVFSF